MNENFNQLNEYFVIIVVDIVNNPPKIILIIIKIVNTHGERN